MDSIHHFKRALSVFVQTAPVVLRNRGQASLCWRREVVDAFGKQNLTILLVDMINTIPDGVASIEHGIDSEGQFSVLTMRNLVIMKGELRA